jgi:spore coat polysaccharide biosynthesis protein SpsF
VKVNVIVQARMGSTRFSGKVLAEVDGRPLIYHLLDRIVGADVDHIIVAIPTPEDEASRRLWRVVSSYGSREDDSVLVVGGDEQNVALRFCRALQLYPCDAFIRICADSPCVNAAMINVVADALRQKIGYIHFTSGVAGTQVQGILTAAFLAYIEEFDEYDQEHVLSYFTRKMSLVVDTPEDLERIRPVLENKMDLDQWMSHILPA